ncbi:MAG: hypothetical protein ABR974_00455 [Bacteroidales bacterium]
MKPYYKKVDQSMMEWGFTIPKGHISDFIYRSAVRLGTARKITLIWDKKKYDVEIRHINRKKSTPVYQIRWEANKDFLVKLRTTFIQSYVILKSQKELFDRSTFDKRHFRTDLEGGEQEVMIFTPVNKSEIRIDVFIKIENKWNTLFERLVNENVFGWIFDKGGKEYLIQKSTGWYKVRDFNKHKNAVNVIYYLANTSTKQLYIGKAEILGKRVKPGRRHQCMPANWDYFKYDIIRQEFSNILERIEDHTIRTIASILKNTENYPSLNISTYTIVNTKWKKLR